MAALFDQTNALSPQNAADAATLAGLADTVSFTRDFWPTLLDRYPDRQLIENGLIAHLVDNKAFVGVASGTTQVFHAEQDSVLTTTQTVSVTYPSGTGVGKEALIVVSAVAFDGQFYNYATVGQNFQLYSNSDIIMNVSAVALPNNSGNPNHTITVYPASGVDLSLYLASGGGDTLLPQDANSTINGDFPNGSVRGWARYGVNFQYSATGSAIVGQDTYNQNFMFNLEGGQTILAPRIFADAMLTAFLRKSAAITRGTGSTFNGNQQTLGFTTAAQTYGLSDDYAPGSVQMADLENIGVRLSNRGAGTELDIFGGYNFVQSIQRNALTPLTGGAVQYISGQQNATGTRPELKQSLGRFTMGKYVVNLNEASEWAHKAMYSPNLGGDTLTNGYWANAFAVIPKEQVAVPRELTNTTYTVTAPMFRVLQLQTPVKTGGQPVTNQVVIRDPAHFNALKYQIIYNETFAAQTMLANKLYFGGTI
jgi:hypothetical protein